MRATKVTWRGFKGSDGEQELAPVTVLCGPNFSGKSRRVEALLLALAGWLPGVSRKSNELHAALASADEMVVGAIVRMPRGVEQTIARRWTRDVLKGSVKSAMSRGRGTADEIMDDLIDEVQVDAAADLMRSSPADRVRALLKACGMNGIRPRVEAVLGDNAELMAALNAQPPGDYTVERLEQLRATVRDLRLGADRELERLKQTAQGLVQVADEPAADDAEALIGKLDAAMILKRDEIGQAKGRIGEIRRRFNEVWAAQKNHRTPADDAQEKELVQKLFALDGGRSPRTGADSGWWFDEAARRQLAVEAQAKLVALAEAVFKEAQGNLAAKCPECGQKVKAKGTAKARRKEWNEAKAAWAAAELKYEEAQAFRDASKQALDASRALEKLRARANGAPAGDLDAIKAQGLAEKGRLDELEAELGRMGAQHKALTDRAWQAQQRRAEQATQAKVRKEMIDADARAKVFRAADRRLAELAETVVADAVAPLLARANEMLPHVGMLVAYKAGDIGLIRADRGFVPARRPSCSGTEEALVGLALSLALAAGGRFKLAVLDEAGRLDAANKRRFLNRVLELVRDGKLDQAIIVDTNPDDWAVMFENPADLALYKVVKL